MQILCKRIVQSAMVASLLLVACSAARAALEVGTFPDSPPEIEYDPTIQPDFEPIIRYSTNPLATPGPVGSGTTIAAPEPGSLALVGSAMGGLWLIRAWRSRRSRRA